MFGWPRKSRSTSGFTCARGYWWLGLMDFRNFFIFYVFEVEESIFGSFTKLPCLGDFENPGQLPVLQVLEGTDDWVLWNFAISLFSTFLRSRNPFLAVSQSYHVWVTLKIQVNFRFYRCSRILMIGSYGFSQCLYFLRFWGQGIHFCQFHEATMFLGDLENPGQLPVSTGAREYWWLGLMDFRNFFISYVFEVKESIFRSFTKLPVRVTSKISRSTSGFTGARGYWWLGLTDFRSFLISYLFFQFP